MPSPLFGAGFRTQHFDEIIDTPKSVDWFEVLSDNFIGVGGPRRAMLERLRADHPIVLHGVGLSIAGSGPLSEEYLKGLRELTEWVAPVYVSDHLCWTSLGGHQSHDLLPVAHTAAVLDHVAERVEHVQGILGRRILLENPSAYVAFRDSDMGEAEFLAALCRRTGCGVLLDVNNLYVNGANLGTDTADYLSALEDGTVGYIHLAGHAVLPDVRIDTHDAEVCEAVWDLFDSAAARFPRAGVIIERDDNLPAFAGLVAEVDRARTAHAAALAGGRGREVDVAANRAEALPSMPRKRGSRTPHPGPPLQGSRLRGNDADEIRPVWRHLQSRFWTHLVDKPLGFDHTAGPNLGALLDDRRPVRVARGMQVYSDAYASGLRRALAVNFPALARVVSGEDFAGLAAAFLRSHPPSGMDFRRLGADFAAFVRSHRFAADYGVDPRVLGDLVALEQAQLEVLDERDDPVALAPQSLAAVAPSQWENARFGFARALRLLRASYDVLPVVEAVGRGKIPERPAAGPVSFLVYRAEGKVHTELLAASDAVVLEHLLAGETFGTACGAAVRDGAGEEAVARSAAGVLVALSARRLLCRLDLGEH